ncbi:hypothetical protein K438DRAFT_208787 [Mycena galopus ATCC 62051]|nr:hypothetical protein K438DRAFT_208787 [Mycena galopus ATCC 62051]
MGRRIALDLDANLSSLRRMVSTSGQNAHRCVGYVREEITLAATTLDSVVVAHDAPSPSERCSICHEVVGLRETLRCICGDPDPGLRHTVKCQACKCWSHSQCVGNFNNEFTCWLCMRLEDSTAGSPTDQYSALLNSMVDSIQSSPNSHPQPQAETANNRDIHPDDDVSPTSRRNEDLAQVLFGQPEKEDKNSPPSNLNVSVSGNAENSHVPNEYAGPLPSFVPPLSPGPWSSDASQRTESSDMDFTWTSRYTPLRRSGGKACNNCRRRKIKVT